MDNWELTCKDCQKLSLNCCAGSARSQCVHPKTHVSSRPDWHFGLEGTTRVLNKLDTVWLQSAPYWHILSPLTSFCDFHITGNLKVGNSLLSRNHSVWKVWDNAPIYHFQTSFFFEKKKKEGRTGCTIYLSRMCGCMGHKKGGRLCKKLVIFIWKLISHPVMFFDYYINRDGWSKINHE